MRIEINAGGLGAIAVATYQANMGSFVKDAESVVSSFKTVYKKACNLSGGIGTLRDAVGEISDRVQQEIARVEAAIDVWKRSNDFLENTIRTDKQVAALVNRNKEEFYQMNPWLKPDPWYEKAWDWVCGEVEKVGDGISAAWNWTKDKIKKGFDWVADTVQKTWNWLVESYKNQGVVYKIVQCAKVAYKITKAVTKVVGALTAFSTGVGVPIAILTLLSAGNDLLSLGADLAFIKNGQYDMIGTTDLLKDLLVRKGGELGDLLGNRELGEAIGSLVYSGMDLVLFFNSADKFLKTFGKLDASVYGTARSSFVWGKAPDLSKSEFSGLMDTLIVKGIFNAGPASPIAFIYTAITSGISLVKKAKSVPKEFTEDAINLFAC